MPVRQRRAAARIALSLAALVPLAASVAQAPAADTILIRGAHVFDGSGGAARVRDVLVRGTAIAQVADRIAAPADARIIEARGQTLLPGLHDLHTHLRATGFGGPDDPGKAYAAYLADGVTSVADFSVYGEMLAPIRAMTGSGVVPAPHLALAVRLSTTGGHGAEYGWGDDFTLQVDTPRAARLAMRKALAYRPGVIKVFTDGWRYGRGGDLTSMDLPTLSAIVGAARAAGVPVITHTVTLGGAKIAAQAGVDAVGHGIGDLPVDAELIRLMRAGGTAYVPTLAVYEPQQTRIFTPRARAALRAPEAAAEAAAMARAAPITALEARRWDVMRANVRTLARAGVAIGVGTDAGIGGVYHGISTIHEIKLLAAAGLRPAAALKAATSASAAILSDAPDRGRIAAGQAADLLLVDGRPDRDLDNLLRVRAVFLAGREVALAPLARLLTSTAMSPLPITPMKGPIDTGRGAGGRTDLGTLLVNNSDAGVDHSDLAFVRLPEPRRPLFMVARFGAAARPFARLSVPLTPGGVQLADARGFTGIAFRAKGSGRYRLLVDHYGVGSGNWFFGTFAAGDDVREVRIPFAAFMSRNPALRFDPATMRKLEFELAGEPGGKHWLQLSDVRFYR